MKNKTYITLSISKEAKQKLKVKAEALGLSLSAYVEKICNADIIFLDENLKKFTDLITLKKK